MSTTGSFGSIQWSDNSQDDNVKKEILDNSRNLKNVTSVSASSFVSGSSFEVDGQASISYESSALDFSNGSAGAALSATAFSASVQLQGPSMAVDGAITGGSLTDGTATLSSGAASGLTTVDASGAITGGSLTDGSATITGGAASGLSTVDASGAITGGSLTDGSATISSGAASGLTTIGSSGAASLDSNGDGSSFGGNLTVSGDLTVAGTTTTLNTEEVLIADHNIILDSNASGSLVDGAGFTISGSQNLTFQYSAGNSRMELKTGGSASDLSVGTLYADSVDIDAGSIDGTTIGSSNAQQGTFTALVGTSLSVSDGDITNVGDIALDSISSDNASGSFSFGSDWTAASQTCADLGTVTTAVINGGSMSGADIDVSSNTLTTSAAQKEAIMEGADADIDIGSYSMTAETFVSDVSTGTAPMTVSSTTLVSNLNADLLDGQEGSYYTDFSNQVVDAGEVGADKVGAGTFNAGTYSFSGSSISALDSLTADTASFNGTVSMGSYQINDLADPSVYADAATKGYVDAQVTAQDLDGAGDAGTFEVDLDSQTFSILGTSNEIETSGSGQALTIGLPSNVTVSNDLTVSNDISVTGQITVNGDIIGQGELQLTSKASLNGDVDLGDSTDDSLTVYTHIQADGDRALDIGADGNAFRNVYATNVYTGDFHMKNERGDWTLFEESDHIRIRNNTTGQEFKLDMSPIK
jgi:hypothetical protein